MNAQFSIYIYVDGHETATVTYGHVTATVTDGNGGTYVYMQVYIEHLFGFWHYHRCISQHFG